MITKKISLLLLSVIILTGCFRNNDCDLEANTLVNQAQLQMDIETIDNYLEDNNITAIQDPSGIRYVINNAGSGSSPEICDNISFSYTGKLLSNGSVFDESLNPITFSLSGLITGFQLGIPLIKEGGSITLYIPSPYGYGSRGAGNDIPPNANLIFEVQLTGID